LKHGRNGSTQRVCSCQDGPVAFHLDLHLAKDITAVIEAEGSHGIADLKQ
jgi:hypothetical protein